ncbi:MAG: hypothetical protein P4L43_04980 [Syntrophobacteraceae bacterium]|nr:hypothetical protein [Syntrophobacteraceae bacterium]
MKTGLRVEAAYAFGSGGHEPVVFHPTPGSRLLLPSTDGEAESESTLLI